MLKTPTLVAVLTTVLIAALSLPCDFGETMATKARSHTQTNTRSAADPVLPGYSRLLDKLNENIAKNPENPDAYVERARFLLNQENGAEFALPDCEKLCELDPESQVFRALLGEAQLKSTKIPLDPYPLHLDKFSEGQVALLEQAADTLTLSVEMDANTAEAGTSLYHRGLARLWLQQYKKAIDDFTAALALHASVPVRDIPELEILSYRAMAYVALTQWEKALADLAASEPFWSVPENVTPFDLVTCPLSGNGSRLAVALAETGNFDEADARFRNTSMGIFNGGVRATHDQRQLMPSRIECQYWAVQCFRNGKFETGIERMFFSNPGYFPRFYGDFSLMDWEDAVERCTNALQSEEDKERKAAILAARYLCKIGLAYKNHHKDGGPLRRGFTPDTEEADADLAAAMKLAPKSKHVSLAFIWRTKISRFDDPQFDKATLEEIVPRIFEDAPDFWPVYYALPGVLPKERHEDIATQMAELAPAEPLAWMHLLNRGFSSNATGPEIVAIYLDAAEACPENVVFLKEMAHACKNRLGYYTGKENEAECKALVRRAEQIASRWIEKHPDSALGYRVRASIRLRHKWDGAEADYKKALALDPRETALLKEYAKAKIGSRAKNAPLAFAVADEALEAVKAYPMPESQRNEYIARILWDVKADIANRGTKQDRVEYMSQAIDLDPLGSRFTRYFDRAKEYAEMGEVGKAADDFGRVETDGPFSMGFEYVFRSQINCLLKAGRVEEAREAVDAKLEKRPRDEKFLREMLGKVENAASLN